MNQAIQFPDREYFDPELNAVCFPVMVNGIGLTCAINIEMLKRRFGDGDAITLFNNHRWDIEEEAEACIHQDNVDSQGWVWLSVR
ncbi:MAG: DUF1488 domain-containing protein [Enterobacterales bacterium endosymbiont of Blomia tropicalis]|uniref:DUF1488 domain-containing protein n=1 Tax=Mixta mediterraneensis TaxID=2758443 RepID=UPI001873F871|nr:DUF1488 domain-containing protein [Mixta mediterraneensis]MBE5253230.1 DUF1488 domain-containing protein [Mixta mediterraneensis]MDL4916262.1 DUF1488 domain-containing protein [Mixta mediterraneensis]